MDLRARPEDSRDPLSNTAVRITLLCSRWRFLAALLLLGAAAVHAGPASQWNATFLGMDGPSDAIVAMAIWDDGTGDALYASFLDETAGGLRTPLIARWNGTGWSSLSQPIDSAPSDLVAFGGRLVAGGRFAFSGSVAWSGVAAWDGRQWRPMGSRMYSVTDLLVHEGHLYAAGFFLGPGNTAGYNVTRWNAGEGEWEELAGPANNLVENLVVYQGKITVGGWFSTIGGVAARSVAVWNGLQWEALPSTNTIAMVERLVVHGEELIAAGGLGFSTGERLARYDGQQWHPLPVVNRPRALVSYQGQLLVGAVGTPSGLVTPGDAPPGNPWRGGTDGPVYSMLVHEGRLYVGGNFGQAGSIRAHRFAVFDDEGWHSSVAGLDGPVDQFIEHDGDLVINGSFRGGDTYSRGVLRWDGERWRGLPGAGIEVYELAVYGGELVAAARIASGGPYAHGVRRWDGQQWTDLGPRMDGSVSGLVSAIAEYSGFLVAGGSFEDIGGLPVQRVAAWNGQQWLPMGAMPLWNVDTLRVHDGELHAMGPSDTVFRWDGQAWISIGPGHTFEDVNDAQIFDGDLVIGGRRSTSALTAPAVLRLRGGVWEPIGDLQYEVISLHVHNGELFAAVYRRGLGDNPVMRWNGSEWEPFGPAPNTGARALGSFKGQLLAGGNFTRIGDRVLPFIAAHGPAHDTTVEIVGLSASLPVAGRPVEFLVEVRAAIAPARGHVTITGSPGGSCTDLTLDVLDGTRAQARCSITWQQACNREIVADYVGASRQGTVWQSSRSAPVVLPMTGAPVCSEVTMFGDGFE